MRLYHFLSREHGLSDLKHRRLKIATLDDINDPFELLATRANKEDRQILQRFREKWAAQFGMLCFSRGWSNPVRITAKNTKECVLALMFPKASTQK